MTERKAALAAIKETEVRLFAAQRQKRAAKMKLIGRFALTKADKTRLLQKLKNREREELAAARLELAERRKAILAAWPYTTWNKCLQHKAALGNETALAVLRSKKEVATPENPPEALAVSQETLDPTQKIMDAHGLSQAQLRALLAVARMREIWGRSARNGADEGSLRHRVDHKGTVIFYLPGGGSVRDAGREIHFSAHDLAALNLAEKLAAVKWGRGAVLADGVFRFAPQTEQEKVLSR